MRQGSEETYAADSITLLWDAPEDTGCLAVTSYVIEAYLSDSWTVVGSSTSTEGVADLSAKQGELSQLRVTAVNSIGQGAASEVIELTSAALPSAPESIRVVEYAASYLHLEWDAPLNTGVNDQSLDISSYQLQVDEGFGHGFTSLTQDYAAL